MYYLSTKYSNTVSFARVLHQRTAIVIPPDRENILSEAVDNRIKYLGINLGDPVQNSNHYLNLILTNSEEFAQLVSLLTIKESYFFREDSQFSIVNDIVLKELIDQKNQKGEKPQLNFLIAGCSRGEEAVTLALSLNEYFLINTHLSVDIKIDAFDIDPEAIRFAQAGTYTSHSFRVTPPELEKKYFKDLADGGKQLDKKILSSINYFTGNLKDFSLFNKKKYDVIFYRNVSIYFDQKDQKGIFDQLSDGLKENGYLFTSSTETAGHNFGILTLHHEKNTYFFNKHVTPSDPLTPRIEDILEKQKSRPAVKSNSKPIPPPPAPVVPKKIPEIDIAYLVEQLKLKLNQKKFEDGSIIASLILNDEPDYIDVSLMKAYCHLNLREDKKAIECCEKVFSLDSWNIDARIILSFVYKHNNDSSNFTRQLKQIIYVKPDLWFPHFFMAQQYELEKVFKPAVQEYKLTVKHIDKGDRDIPYLRYFPLPFHKSDVKEMCIERINAIQSINN